MIYRKHQILISNLSCSHNASLMIDKQMPNFKQDGDVSTVSLHF